MSRVFGEREREIEGLAPPYIVPWAGLQLRRRGTSNTTRVLARASYWLRFITSRCQASFAWTAAPPDVAPGMFTIPLARHGMGVGAV
jgi:hypothetical protein